MIDKILMYLDSFFVEESIFYKLTSKCQESTNISNFLKEQLDSKMLDPIIIQEGWHEVEDDDRLIYLIMKWVVSNITYTRDFNLYGSIEYWAGVDKTLINKKGDCEDGAILIIAFARKCGIPKEKLKLWCGDTKYGGHACAIYKSEYFPYVWNFMDWCMEPQMYVPGHMKRNSYVLKKDLNIIPYNMPYGKAWFIVDEEKGSGRLK